MIVTAHQPGYLPGVSVVSKIARADAVVWLDDVRFTTPGYVNRNQLPRGEWLTVPVDRRDHLTPIREVTIAGEDWQGEHVNILRERYAGAEHFDPYIFDILAGELAFHGSPLVDLNLELIEWIIGRLGFGTREFRQSQLAPTPRGSVSSRIVHMVQAVGGSAYLTGPGARLDAEVFEAGGIDLLFFRFAGENPSVIDAVFTDGALPTRPEQEVSVA
jgi:hypothetical protein